MSRNSDAMRFALWALTHRAIPSEREIVKEFDATQEQAKSWLAAWKPIRAEIERAA